MCGRGRACQRRTGFVQESGEVPEQAGEPLQLLLAHTLRQVGLYLGQAPGGGLDAPEPTYVAAYEPEPMDKAA